MKKTKTFLPSKLLLLLVFAPLLMGSAGGIDDLMGVALGGLVVSLIVFLIFREFFCWYWKINVRLSELEKMNKTLYAIHEHLTGKKLPPENTPPKPATVESAPVQPVPALEAVMEPAPGPVGTGQIRICPTCGAHSGSEDDFCGGCGNKF